MESQSPKYAVFTFFCKNGCPPCNAFKGLPPSTRGKLMTKEEEEQERQLISKGPWGQLSKDPELNKMGVEFIMFKFGAIQNDKGEMVDVLEIPPIYQDRVKYAPYLELRLPNDLTQGEAYNGDRQDWRNVKKWIIQQLNSKKYQDYKRQVDQGQIEPTTKADIRKDMENAINEPKPDQIQVTNPRAATVSGMGTQPTPKIIQVGQTKRFLPSNK